MAAALVVVLKTVFVVLACVIAATFIYTFATDGQFSLNEVLTPWMITTLLDFYINATAIGAWIIYKDSNYFISLIWILMIICVGSLATCVYIALQLFNLTPQESQHDPIYFVLLRRRKMDGSESNAKLTVVSAKVLFSILGCFILGTFIYTWVTDGSPFRQEVYTPWFSAVIVDFYFHVFALAVWVAYKEPNWKTAAFWIILLICFGSAATCLYIVVQLFHLSHQDPVSLVLFRSSNREENAYEEI